MKQLFLLSAIVLAAGPALAAPIALPGAMHYTQDFNGLARSPDNNFVNTAENWSDDTTIPGWYLFQAGNGTQPANTTYAATNYAYRVTDGSLQVGQPGNLLDTGWFYSMGTVLADLANADRALGAVPISAKGELSFLAVFQNTAAAPLRLDQIAYNAEVWRTNQNSQTASPPNNNTKEALIVWWRTATTKAALLNMTVAAASSVTWDADLATTPNSQYVTGWNRLPNADFKYTSTLANTKVYESYPVSAIPATNIEILPGQFFALRWGNLNDRDADALMGIDDLDLTFGNSGFNISGTAANILRSDAGTPREPGDDTVSFDLTVSGGGVPGVTWGITSPPTLTSVNGAYGVPVSVTGVPITLFTGLSHVLTLTVADQGNPAFTAIVPVVAPWGQITPAPATGFTYLDKGTAATTDDQVTFFLSADGVYTGTGYGTSIGNGIYGLPLGAVAAAPGTFTTYTFTDNADPSITATLSVFPPAIIGTNATTLTPRPLLSLPVAQNAAIQWNVNAAAGTIQQTGVALQADHVLTSEVVDLTTVPDATFSATLTAVTGASTGFEPEDSFALDLIVDGVAVSALGASDTNSDGRLVGVTELQATAGATRTFNFTRPIPAAANSVQVRLTGNSNSTAETFTVSALKLEIPQPAVTLSAASNIVRHDNGQGLADDTVSFNVTVTGVNGGSGWTTTSATPASGAFGLVTFTVPAGGSSVTVRVTDNTFPNAFADVTVALPGPYIIGSYDTGAGTTPIFTTAVPVPAAEWVISGTPPVMTMHGQTAYALPLKTVTTEVISVAGAAGALRATAHLHVHDTSGGFDAADEFDAWIILNGNTAVQIPMITAGDTDGSGSMTGAELCPAPLVNPTTQDLDYPLSANIPAGTGTVQIVITGLVNSINETMIVSAISIGAGPADTDSDGMPDAYEDANGLNKNSSADRDLDLDADSQSNYLEFLAGTTANDSKSFLHIVNGTLNAATGAGSTTWTSVAGKRYQIQLSADLSAWTNTGSVITAAAGATTTATYTLPGAPLTGARFLRVKVVP